MKKEFVDFLFCFVQTINGDFMNFKTKFMFS